MNELERALQAVLFVRPERVKWKEVAALLGASMDEVLVAAEGLRAALQGTALALLSDEEGVELVTAPDVAALVASLEPEKEEELSKAAAETLAVVAYRGPLSRQEVSAIRGVESRTMLRQLVQRGLVAREEGKAGVVLYDVSMEALKQLGIENRSELPEFELLSSNERLQEFLQEREE